MGLQVGMANLCTAPLTFLQTFKDVSIECPHDLAQRCALALGVDLWAAHMWKCDEEWHRIASAALLCGVNTLIPAVCCHLCSADISRYSWEFTDVMCLSDIARTF